jgi:dimethylamine corrinoid protein
VAFLLPYIEADKGKFPLPEQRKKILLATVKGDVHDIGKNIVKAMLTGAGLTLFDMGRDVPVKNLVEKAKSEGAQILATSTLMTPTLAGMKEIERILKEENLKGKVKTVIGGGATSKEFSNQIGANGWAYDAVEAVAVVQGLLK